MPSYKLNEVFHIGRPTITEVVRSGDAVEDVLSALSTPGMIVYLLGPTKSGKTQLTRQAMADEDPIKINGAHISVLQEFFDELRRKLSLDLDTSESYVVDACKAEGRPIIIDDFHFIGGINGKRTRSAILKRMKSFLDDSNLTVVIITLSDKLLPSKTPEAYDAFGREESVLNPPWTSEELSQIANKGFTALNISVSESLIERLARNAHGNPLLMQTFCRELCWSNGIKKTSVDEQVAIEPSDEELSRIYQKPAARLSISMAPVRKQRDDKLLRLKNGVAATMIDLVLLGISRVQIGQPIGMNTLKQNCKTYLSDGHQLTTADVKSAVETLIERLELSKDSNITASYLDGYMYILHPFFKLYIDQVLRPELGIESIL